MTFFSALVRFLGSFGLAVALLFILFLLTWFGTLEQVDHGLYEVQKRYFESAYVLHYLGPVPILLPGGMLVMVLFAANLAVGGLLRIRWNARNAGVIIAHFGMAFLMVAGAVKQWNSEDGLMKLRPGQQDSVFESSDRYEVVVWDATEQLQSGGMSRSPITEYRIEPDQVRQASGVEKRTFTSEVLPFQIVLERFLANSRVMPAAGIGVPENPVIDGWTARYVAPAKVDSPRIPAVYATVLAPDGSRRQGLLWGMETVPWTFELGGRSYAMSLRRELFDLPFELRLDEFRKDFHPGVGMAKAFESDITRFKPQEPERQVLVRMNEPLREDGYVVYQAQYGTDPDGVDYTVLQIVRNPSDQWPKWATYVIGLGLLLAFGYRLRSYLGSERRRRAREVTA